MVPSVTLKPDVPEEVIAAIHSRLKVSIAWSDIDDPSEGIRRAFAYDQGTGRVSETGCV